MNDSTVSAATSQPKTTSRTTKAGKIDRTISCTRGKPGIVVVTVIETLHRKRSSSSELDYYFLRIIPCQLGGIGIEVKKWGSDEVRHVLLNAPRLGTTCDCEHGTYRPNDKPCRHVEMCKEALRLGLFAGTPEAKITIEIESDDCGRYHAVAFRGETVLRAFPSFVTAGEAEASARLWARWEAAGCGIEVKGV